MPIKKGEHISPATEFKKGEHWRKRREYWDREWLRHEYEDKVRSAADIAKQFGITENAILFWLEKHGIPTRTMSEIRSKKHWGAVGEKNPMYGKRGPLNKNWRGGTTPFRQSLYAKAEWLKIARGIRKRDKVCRLCGGREKTEIHHIIRITDAPLLAMDEGNLILLCKECHNKIRNKERKWEKKLKAIVEGG